MEQDCFNHVKKFHKCQEHNYLIHAHVSKLRAHLAIWPFFGLGFGFDWEDIPSIILRKYIHNHHYRLFH